MKPASVRLLMILLVAFMVSTFSLAADQAEVDKERQEIRKRTKEVLAQLYKAEPKANIQKAAGYDTFSNFGMKIFILGSGTGKGVAVDNKTKKEVFMKMIELQTGAAFQDALAIAPGVWLYQLTETGVALELTVKGTKYYKDDDLNG